jgi:hypothetical protein
MANGIGFVNWRVYGRQQSGLIFRYYSTIFSRNLGNARRTLIRVGRLRNEVSTSNFSDTMCGC